MLAEARGLREDAAALYSESAKGWGEWGQWYSVHVLGVGRCSGDENARREGEATFERLGAVPFKALAA